MHQQEHLWETRHLDKHTAKDADQAELKAVKYGSANLDAGIYDDRIAEALDDYETPSQTGDPQWAKSDATLDNAASKIGDEIRRRQRTLEDAYPFSITGNTIAYQRSNTLVYEFCLAVSLAKSLNMGEYAKLPVAFERLARDVLMRFLGPDAKGMRTGWPPDKHEDRPTRFKQVIDLLHKQTKEWVWSPDPDMPNDPAQNKDCGIDFVVWKEISDGRSGRLFFLGQCACGNTYESKFYDIESNFSTLETWIKPISYVKAIRVFTVPRHIPNDVFFNNVNKKAGFTLDRARITLIAETGDAKDYITKQAKIPYGDLVRLVISGFQAAGQEPAKRPRKAAGARRSRSRGSGA